MIVAGIGCRKGARAEAIEQAIDAALERCGLERTGLDALATEADKGEEPGLVAAARRLALPLILVDQAGLGRAAKGALTHSARVQELKGVPSVAETAALAAAGRASRLIGPRVAMAQAACAIAVGDGPGGVGP